MNELTLIKMKNREIYGDNRKHSITGRIVIIMTIIVMII